MANFRAFAGCRRAGKVKRTFTEEELRRQKKNAAAHADDADEYANSIKIIG